MIRKLLVSAAIVIVMIFSQSSIGGTITGTVTDSNGTAVPNIWVWSENYDTSSGGNGDYTDASGEYEITNLSAGIYRVAISTWGTDYVRQYYNNTELWDRATPVSVSSVGQTENINFSLKTGGSISGFVKNLAGNGISNVRIDCSVNDVYYADGDTTDVNGFYKVNGLLAGHTYRVAAKPQNTTDYKITQIFVNVPEIDDYNAQDIVLEEGALTVSGKVTDKATAFPLENIWVFCWLGELENWTGDYTDVNGVYILTNLPPGGVEIRAEPTTHYARIGSEFELTENVQDLDFALPVEAILSGKVLDSETAEPLAGIEVTYWSDRYAVWNGDYTDLEGLFSISSLPPGICEIKARPVVDTGYAWSLPWGSNWTHLEEGEHKSGDFIALHKGALVSGYIKDPNGEPFGFVEYAWSGRASEGWADSNSSGHYEIRLPVGTYSINLDNDAFGGLQQNVTITDINAVIDVNDITAYTELNGSHISGDVNNAGGFSKIGEFLVVVFETGTIVEPNSWFSIRAVSETGLEDAGPFSIGSLPSDANYDVCLLAVIGSHDDIQSIALRDLQINVAAGVNNLNLSYDSQGGVIQGSVENTDGLAVLGATVLLNDPCTGDFAGFGDVDANGEYVIYNVAAGTYNATAVHSKYANASTTVVVVDSMTTVADSIIIPFSGEKEAADLNGNGFVDTDDLPRFSNQWLESGALEANFDQQGNVDFTDWAILAENWFLKAIWYHN